MPLAVWVNYFLAWRNQLTRVALLRMPLLTYLVYSVSWFYSKRRLFRGPGWRWCFLYESVYETGWYVEIYIELDVDTWMRIVIFRFFKKADLTSAFEGVPVMFGTTEHSPRPRPWPDVRLYRDFFLTTSFCPVFSFCYKVFHVEN